MKPLYVLDSNEDFLTSMGPDSFPSAARMLFITHLRKLRDWDNIFEYFLNIFFYAYSSFSLRTAHYTQDVFYPPY